MSSNVGEVKPVSLLDVTDRTSMIKSPVLFCMSDICICEYDYNNTYVTKFYAHVALGYLGQCLQFDFHAHTWCGFL